MTTSQPVTSVLSGTSTALFQGGRAAQFSMGADLYIRATPNSNRKRPDQPVFAEAYFRDPYNLSSVLWTLGLSWCEDVLPLLNENLELTGLSLRLFRDRVYSAEQRLPTAEELKENGARVESNGNNSIKEWHEHFVRKRIELLKFLDIALEERLPILCSL